MGGKQVLPSGAAKNGKKKQALSPKSKAAAVEEERNKAEEMLEKKLREKKEAANAGNNLGPSFSYAGYDNLRGELKHVLVTKVVRKLGIAIDGGANTKQKAVIIREISVSIILLIFLLCSYMYIPYCWRTRLWGQLSGRVNP